jgi:hypothetical protein
VCCANFLVADRKSHAKSDPIALIAMVNVEHDFHMAEGEGDWSYSKNSRRQVIIILPFLECNYSFM